MKGKLRFLGTGSSVGVPVIGCTCAVCRSLDPMNMRLRPSVLINLLDRQFLIDAGPDFRQQALRDGITNLDGVIFSHAHRDHTAGIDDLRPIYYKRKSLLPFLLSPQTAQDIQKDYSYLFKPILDQKNFENRFSLQLLPGQSGEVSFEGVPIRYVSYTQAGMLVNGYRFGNLAYLSDIREFSSSIFDELKGIKYLIISALRYTPSQLHFSVDEAVDFSREIKAEFVWLTHLSHELDYHQTNSYLPPNIRLAYDGLEIEFK